MSERREKTPAERVMPPVVFQLPGMDAVSVKANLKYTGVENPHLLMDVYTPANLAPDERRPIVFCIHGAGAPEYKAKDWGLFQSWGRLIAAAGMVGVIFVHRLAWPKPFLANADADVRAALDYIRANAGLFGADPDRVCVMTWSGGGPLLGTVLREKPTFVRGILAFYAFLDIQQPAFDTSDESSESIRAFSPITYISKDASSMIPMFVVRAGRDEVPTMNDSIDRFVAAAIAANAPITLMNHPFGEHGFDNQNDDERSREIIKCALGFMQARLKS